MSDIYKIVDEKSDAVYPIRTVSQLTGVNVITLRAWETRHGLINPERKESGHRLYTREHIDLINRVVGLLDRGIRIGQVKAFLESGKSQEDISSGKQDGHDTWRRYLEGMLGAVIQFDEMALDVVYSEALSHYAISTVTERLLKPLMIELGKRWGSGLGTVAEEHFFGFYLRNKLGARFHHRTINENGKKLLMACLPGEQHLVGLLLLALAMNESGFCPVVLGANLPLAEIPAAAEKVGCEAIILSGVVKPGEGVLDKELPGLVAAVHVPVFIGGQVSIDYMDEVRRAGVHALGTDINVGLQSIEASLSGIKG